MLKAMTIEFEWYRDKHSRNPTCYRTIGNGYSAYVLIPYEGDNDPDLGAGVWVGVAQHRGRSGFLTKEDAIRYCEETIQNFAQAAVNSASNFLPKQEGE